MASRSRLIHLPGNLQTGFPRRSAENGGGPRRAARLPWMDVTVSLSPRFHLVDGEKEGQRGALAVEAQAFLNGFRFPGRALLASNTSPCPCPRMAPCSLALGKVGTNRVHYQGFLAGGGERFAGRKVPLLLSQRAQVETSAFPLGRGAWFVVPAVRLSIMPKPNIHSRHLSKIFLPSSTS
jgi:hypothetical protein